MKIYKTYVFKNERDTATVLITEQQAECVSLIIKMNDQEYSPPLWIPDYLKEPLFKKLNDLHKIITNFTFKSLCYAVTGAGMITAKSGR